MVPADTFEIGIIYPMELLSSSSSASLYMYSTSSNIVVNSEESKEETGLNIHW